MLCILTSAPDAANTWPILEDYLRFQLWIAIKLAKPIYTPGNLPSNHAALLISTRYRRNLKHAKTRIAYTYCPACDKTTKDYGGKKHTYHYYGTLMSDVWRDFAWDFRHSPHAIEGRLADLLGVPPHSRLHSVDLLGVSELKASHDESSVSTYPGLNKVASGPKVSSSLAQGDCLQILADLPEKSVDFAFADPPYNLAKSYDRYDDTIDTRDYFTWCDRWIDALARVLREGCSCAILNIPHSAIRHFRHMAESMEFQTWIVWEGLSLPVRMIMPAHYSLVCFSKGPPRPLPGFDTPIVSHERAELNATREFFCSRQACLRRRRAAGVPDTDLITDLWWDIHRLKHNSRRVDHPCQLPPALMRRLIALFTHPGELVLDPFNGAGTTTLCAQQMERRYLGIELSPEYHQLAQNRHAHLARGGDPFEKAQATPKAKNSRVKRLLKTRYAVPKKTLQLDVKRIAGVVGHTPSREEVIVHSPYPVEYFDSYFVDWGEVTAAARTTGMTEDHRLTEPGIENSQPRLF